MVWKKTSRTQLDPNILFDGRKNPLKRNYDDEVLCFEHSNFFCPKLTFQLKGVHFFGNQENGKSTTNLKIEMDKNHYMIVFVCVITSNSAIDNTLPFFQNCS